MKVYLLVFLFLNIVFSKPDQITDLSASTGVNESEVILSWTYPGPDKLPTGSKYYIMYHYLYEIVWSTTNAQIVLSTGNINPGDEQYYIVDDLERGVTYYFHIWISSSSLEILSEISNRATAWAQIDFLPPGKITDLSANPGNKEKEIILNWTSPGDNDYERLLDGTFKIQYSSYVVSWDVNSAQITISTVTNPGDAQVYKVENLEIGATYFFRIWSIDEVGKVSDISNGATTWAQVYLINSIANLSALPGDVERTAKLSWTYPGPYDLPEGSKFLIQYFRSPEPINWNKDNAQVIISTGPVSVGSNHSYVVSLSTGGEYYFRIWSSSGIFDACSDISNAATTYVFYSFVNAIDDLKAYSDPTEGVADGEVKLVWTHPGPDKLPVGSKYFIQYFKLGEDLIWDVDSAQIEISTAGVDVGESQVYFINDLAIDTTYYFRIWISSGIIGHLSDPSNIASTGTISWDLIPPSGVTDLSGDTVREREIVLRWTSPGDNERRGVLDGEFIIQYQYEPPTTEWKVENAQVFISTVAYPGEVQIYRLGDLTPGTSCYVRLWSRDYSLNVSTISNEISLEVLGYFVDPITTLTALTGPEEGTIELSWNYPGPDKLPAESKYYIQYNKQNTGWDYKLAQIIVSTANVSPGDPQWYVVDNLDGNSTYYFCVWSSSSTLDRTSPPSNIVSTTTLFDLQAPAKITTLLAVPGAMYYTIDLSWNSPGDNGFDGVFRGSFTVQWTDDPFFTGWDPFSAGNIVISTENVTPTEEQYWTVGGLTEGVTYYFRIWAIDEVGNVSDISEGATTWAQYYRIDPITNLSALTGAIDDRIELSWTYPGPYELPSTGRFEIGYSSTATNWDDMKKVIYNLTSSTKPGANFLYIFDELQGSTSYSFLIKTYGLGKVSPLSNLAVGWTPLDDIPPKKIDDLTATKGLQVHLEWTVTGDNGDLWMITNGKVEIRASISPLLDPEESEYVFKFSTTVPAGMGGLIDVSGFMPDVKYYFWVRYCDEVGNWSEWSNRAEAIPNYFGIVDAYFVPVMSSYVGWADYDGDGDFDIGYCGYNPVQKDVCKIYKNVDGKFEDSGISLLGVRSGKFQWGDFDSDGYPDIAITGLNGGTQVSRIYKNLNGNNFSNIGAPVIQVCYSSLGWADFDNDLDLDLIISGWDTNISDCNLGIYKNDNGNFVLISTSVIHASWSSIAWGDYDNDGDLDLGILGKVRIETLYYPMTKIYRNDNGKFTDINANLPDIEKGTIEWIDYDNDGDLDLVIGGYTTAGNIFKIFRNDDGSFTDINANLIILREPFQAWGDFDNNGWPDLFLGGTEINTTGAGISKLYSNSNGNFQDTNIPLPGTTKGSAAWCDYDSDGDLDIIITGAPGTGSYLTRVLRSFIGDYIKFNIPPSPPTSFYAFYSTPSLRMHFRWNIAQDAETPSPGLYYTVRASTSTPVNYFNSTVIPWKPTTPLIGNYPHGYVSPGQPGFYFKPTLENVTYYWQVRSIDAGLRGSNWSSEQQYYFSVPPARITDLVGEPGPIDGTIKLTWTMPGDDDIYGELKGSYKIQHATYSSADWSKDNAQTIVSTSTLPGTSQTHILTGLVPGGTYYIRVWACDEVDNAGPSDIIKTFAKITIPTPVADLVAIPISGSKIRLRFKPSGSPVAERYEIFFSSWLPIDFSTPTAVIMHSTQTWLYWETGPLEPNKRYYFVIRTVSKYGIIEKNEAVVSAVAVDIPADLKAYVEVPYNSRRISGNCLTLMAGILIGDISDVKEILFQYKPSTATEWIDIVPKYHQNPDPKFPYFIHWDISNLNDNFSYNLRAKVLGKDGNYDPYPIYTTVIVFSQDPDIKEEKPIDGEHLKVEKIEIGRENIVYIGDEEIDKLTQIIIPDNAIEESITHLRVMVNPRSIPKLNKDIASAGEIRYLQLGTGQKKLSNEKKLTITFHYKNQDNDHRVDGSNVKIKNLGGYCYVQEEATWKKIESTINTYERSIIATTNFVSYIGLFASIPLDLVKAHVYPNPFKPSKGHTYIYFTDLPKGLTRFRIFNVAGEMVFDKEVEVINGEWWWNVRNNYGKEIASGVYIYLVTNDKGQKKIGKLAIIR